MSFVKKYKWELLISALCAAVLAAFYLLHPRCLIEQFTGVPCPTCGMTRAWACVLHGRFSRAFYCHPLFWSVPGIYLFLFFRNKTSPRAMTVIAFCIAGAFIAVWLIRLFLLPDSMIYIL